MSTETIPNPGRPNEITTPEMMNKIHDIVLNDRKVKVHEIPEIVSISTERVVNILCKNFCYCFLELYIEYCTGKKA